MRPTLSLIVAVAANSVIGASGDMPWKLSTDLRRFKALTLGKPVIMGRKTFASIGKALPGRTNIVISRTPIAAEGVATVDSIDAAIELAAPAAAASGGEIMIIGGGTLYAATIGIADRLYVTHVLTAPVGDTFFPPIDPALWRVVSAESVPASPRDTAATTFTIYERVSDSAGATG